MALKKRQYGRTYEQIRNHYEVEKAIAEKLKKADRAERSVIYKTMYHELFAKVPDHPRLSYGEDPEVIKMSNKINMKLIEPFINTSTVFVEFGPGRGRFAKAVCDHVKHVKTVYGIDIANQINVPTMPENFKLMVYNGYNLDLKNESVDVVYSRMFIEHLHPEDTELHFLLAKRILSTNGIYIFITPHRFTGPNDISRYFSSEPEGFHIKEWTYAEIDKLLKKAGYSYWWGYRIIKGRRIRIQFSYLILIENILSLLPKKLKKSASNCFLSEITVVAVK